MLNDGGNAVSGNVTCLSALLVFVLYLIDVPCCNYFPLVCRQQVEAYTMEGSEAEQLLVVTFQDVSHWVAVQERLKEVSTGAECLPC